MSKEYDMTFQSRDEAVFGLERLLIPAERLVDRLEWLAREKNPQFGEQTWAYDPDNNTHSLRESSLSGWLEAGGRQAIEDEVAAAGA